jgi:hypothetical protein
MRTYSVHFNGNQATRNSEEPAAKVTGLIETCDSRDQAEATIAYDINCFKEQMNLTVTRADYEIKEGENGL